MSDLIVTVARGVCPPLAAIGPEGLESCLSHTCDDAVGLGLIRYYRRWQLDVSGRCRFCGRPLPQKENR